MLKRALFFSTPYCLSLRDGQMIIHTREAPDQRKSIPIEDIGFVVLENQQVSITLPLLNALSDNNVAVIFCGENRMPNAMLMNLDSNRTQGESYRNQIEASEPLKKGLWKQIVEAKVRNQAALLRKLGRDGDKLKPYYMNVKSADADNREGIAAKIYWSELFGAEFNRSREGLPPNNLLNYGYTLLRAAVARAIMGSGLFPAFGIFHRNGPPFRKHRSGMVRIGGVGHPQTKLVHPFFLWNIAELPERQSLKRDPFRRKMKLAQAVKGEERRPGLYRIRSRWGYDLEIHSDFIGIERIEILFVQLKAGEDPFIFHAALRKAPVKRMREADALPFSFQLRRAHCDGSVLLAVAVKRNAGGEDPRRKKAAPRRMMSLRKQILTGTIQTDRKTGPFARFQRKLLPGLEPCAILVLDKDPGFQRRADPVGFHVDRETSRLECSPVGCEQKTLTFLVEKGSAGERSVQDGVSIRLSGNVPCPAAFRFPFAGKRSRRGQQPENQKQGEKCGNKFHGSYFCVQELTSQAGGPL